MREHTRRTVDAWWRALFGLDDGLWSAVTVRHPHGVELGDYAGWYVAWRGSGVHVSAPSSAAAAEVLALMSDSASMLQQLEFWQSFARRRGLAVIGPGVHRYLDVDPGPAPDVREVAPVQLRDVAAGVDEADLWESGFDVHLDETGVVGFAAEGGGAVLTELDGAPRNLALLVVPGARGRGVGTELGRAAASYAVREHGYARWRSREANVASSRAAERLGFEPYVTQLAIR